VDELWSGVAVSGAGSVERELSLSHAGYATFAFALPLVAAAVLEAGVALLSDVRGRAQLMVVGQAALAASLGFLACTTSPWGLTAGLAMAGAASGVACGAAQALLVASSRGEGVSGERARGAMVRWSLYCGVGDVVTPLLTGAALALGHSYRAAMGAIALAVFVQCVASARLVFRGGWQAHDGETPGRERDEDAEPPPDPLRAALARALRLPRLWAWLFTAASCTLLDELVIALAVLRFEREGVLRGSLATAAAVTFSVGSLVGTAIADRLGSRLSTRRVLIASGALCALALGALFATHGAVASLVALFAVGVTCAPHHPLAFARAYDQLPDRPGTVQAIAQLFVVIDVAAPLALGVVADHSGLGAAVACLGLQPAIVILCALACGPAKVDV